MILWRSKPAKPSECEHDWANWGDPIHEKVVVASEPNPYMNYLVQTGDVTTRLAQYRICLRCNMQERRFL